MANVARPSPAVLLALAPLLPLGDGMAAPRADTRSDPTATVAPRVRVISHDRLFAETLEASLRQAGLTVSPSVTAPDTRAGASVAGLDIVVLETVAEDEAVALVEELREASPLTEIIAIAPHSVVTWAVKALRAGAFSVLAYPVSTAEVVGEITRAFARKQRAEKRIRQIEGGLDGHHAADPHAATGPCSGGRNERRNDP